MPSIVEERGGDFGQGVYGGIECVAQFVQVAVSMPVIRTDVLGDHRLKGQVDSFEKDLSADVMVGWSRELPHTYIVFL